MTNKNEFLNKFLCNFKKDYDDFLKMKVHAEI